LSQTAIPDPSEIAGRYQVVKRLGAGAFGTVFKAKDRLLGRMVAIKTIRLDSLVASGASAEEMLDRFKREAMVSAQLKHPNIVTIYDIGDADGSSYLAMEFIDGVGLEKVIAQGRVPLERAALVAAQVADALDFAHRNHVVHRDIKPANIMLEAGDRVKVTDFGIAKVMDSAEHLTMTGSLLGTPSYMSPEQARGTPLDGRSDLFAVGCVLYEMLAGAKAFRGDSITGLIFKIITEEPMPIRELEPSVPEEMARVISRALSKAPETRYQSGRELHDDLQAFVRPGGAPTLRQSEVATAPPTILGQTASGALPTQVARGPAAPPPTFVSAAPTVRAADARAPQHPAPPAPVYAPPPSYAPPPAYVPPPAARATTPPPAPVARPTGRGPGAGLVIGLVLGALVLVGGAGAAAWYFFIRQPPTTTVAEGSVPPASEPGTTLAPANATAVTDPPSTIPPFGVGSPPGTAVVSDAATGDTAVVPPRPEPATRPDAAAPPPRAAEPRGAEADMEGAFLDQQPPQLDGRAAGERVAGAYRSDQGSNAGSGFGASGRLRARERFPSATTPPERRGVFVLLNLMHLEAVHHRRTGRYGTFAEATPLRLANPRTVQRNGYRFDLTVEEDGYRIVATPLSMGLRGLVGDDSGFVRFADDE
jgi:serine/threonine-protein kinase